MPVVREPLKRPRQTEPPLDLDAAQVWGARSISLLSAPVEGSTSIDHAEDNAAAQVEVLRRALYAEVHRQELALLEEELAQLEALEGMASADLAAGIAHGAVLLTMRRAWWLARWRLRERLRETPGGEAP